MEYIPRIKTPEPDETAVQLHSAYVAIERLARLRGRGDVLMLLDRIPGLLLGPANRVSENAVAMATDEAMRAIEEVHVYLEKPKP